MPAPVELARVVLAFLVATGLAVRGRKRGSLSASGSVAAFVVGFLSFASSARFGLTLITFYVTSTKATRFRSALKARVEDEHGGPSGNRGASQVCASSAPAVGAALVYCFLFRWDSPILRAAPLRSSLNLFYMLYFAACSGDTFASELGTVLGSAAARPFLITAPTRRVPRGTNGGVTLAGTAASAIGGLVIGITYYLLGPDLAPAQLALLPLGLLGGLLGSALDSLLGSVLQLSVEDTGTGIILRGLPPPDSPAARRVRHICGRDILSGETVNLIAAALTGASAPLALPLFFR
jgi:uncharacterized protein (TIGR00297 family)